MTSAHHRSLLDARRNHDAEDQATTTAPSVDPLEQVGMLLAHLRSSPDGLASRDAARRLVTEGRNELVRTRTRHPLREFTRQLTHPLALLLWAAAALSFASGSPQVAVAVVIVIVINAVFAFVQEQHAERAVEALREFLPAQATVVRDGHRVQIPAVEVVPGDVVVLMEGDRVPADVRLLDGGVEVDLSALTGESLPAFRSADLRDGNVELTRARDLVFSGTSCTSGEAHGVVFATGMRTELGRIAALTQRITREESPLEAQVRRVAKVIAVAAVGVGVAFLPIGILVAGLPPADAVAFTIGLIVANVPEGLLPTISLALAMGVRSLAASGALVKRLSAVETLGSATVICTDKTGTLTVNSMRVTEVWTPATGARPVIWTGDGATGLDLPAARRLLRAAAYCNDAELDSDGRRFGDPTELALLEAAAVGDEELTAAARAHSRRVRFHFDPALRIMSSVDDVRAELTVHVKGAPESVLPLCTGQYAADGTIAPFDVEARRTADAAVEDLAVRGLRTLAVAQRDLNGEPVPATRQDAEQRLVLLGLVAMVDPPRPEVAGAVARCHRAGIRIIVISGDAGPTVASIAGQIGIVGDRPRVVTGAELQELGDADLDALLHDEQELVFARSAPETKLRITDALRDAGEIVAMTGDGVNDAPALRRADIGVAMGRAGTEVAREAATMILTDDNFATIVTAVESGRRVYDNVRKFVCYIFAHLTPEVVPFLVFALSGGAIPLPLTVLQILAIDLGTETLPALALGREPSEPGIMDRPPRPRTARVIDGPLAWRAWGFLGLISAVLVLGGYLLVLTQSGWVPGADVAAGALAVGYRQATTMTFAGIVACQIGTGLAARTDHASLRDVGLLSNPLLLWGIAFEVVVLVAIVLVPFLQAVFGTAPLNPEHWLVLSVFPVIVWGADELRRAVRRRRS